MAQKTLYLLDGMALVYRAHFAFATRPILTSTGVNTSALHGFTQTVLDLIKRQDPSHLAVAFDTAAPTQRHIEFPEYKATRQEMPEDLAAALPHVRRMLEALRIPAIALDGYEADDLIGTLVVRAETEGFISYMVTSDKDFGQLVTDRTLLFKPGRMGDSFEILGPAEICARWGITRPEQVVDVLALMGDASDNIPGVPGIGEKTAMKLVAQFGTVEALLARAAELTGRFRESLEKNRELALMSKRLATIQRDVPCLVSPEDLRRQEPDLDQLKQVLIEFELNSIGRRFFGEDFRTGRTSKITPASEAGSSPPPDSIPMAPDRSPKPEAIPSHYKVAGTPAEQAALREELGRLTQVALHVHASAQDPKQARVLGLAFSAGPGQATYVPIGKDRAALEPFRDILESPALGKTGHGLKHSLSVLRWNGIAVQGPLFDTQIAHSLVEPDMRHSLDYVAEVFLGHTPAPWPELDMETAGWAVERWAALACEAADLGGRLRNRLEPLLREQGQERVFYEIESPLLPVLVAMEHAGIRVDAGTLEEFGGQLGREITTLERSIQQAAGTPFNLNSPKQLGTILFDVLRIGAAPKKTRTGQYATDEQTLSALAPDHPVVRELLEHRAASKLKSTYADALPTAIWPATGRIHTTYNQVATSTGRLNSQDPNLQNIPIRTERGQEIRKAFVPRDSDHLLLSADYSQIELRIIAALTREPGLVEAFRNGADVHTATAARVYGVFPNLVTPEMRRKAKMVNYGIAYGISAFGLSQRLGIPRKEAAGIIDEYFRQFGGIRRFMDETIESARARGYVKTITGRRRYVRDINSANATVRAAAERNAINAPIQGSAADLIKIAMVNIARELDQRQLRTRLLLQVHDELVFDLYRPEETQVRALVTDKMAHAIDLPIPIEVDIGVGETWLAAH